MRELIRLDGQALMLMECWKPNSANPHVIQPVQHLKHKLMTNPKENEEINEELSTDELKAVSGGFAYDTRGKRIAVTGAGIENLGFKNGHRTGSGMTKDDYRKSMRKKLQLGSEGELW